ncbi:MAG TPA: MFS transporter [Candidatus Limnocylindrales bacterium]
MTGRAPEASGPAAPLRPRGRLLSPILFGVASGSILVPLNSTMLAVALPGVMTEFGLGAATVATLVSLYLGAVAIALPISGSLEDRYGPRPTFLAGVIGFGLASLVAALSGSFLLLQVARVLQAASGALVSTSSAVLVRQAAPADRRGEAFGVFDLLTSTSAAFGPFVGGVIVGAFSWRAMFVLAVPISIVAAALVGFVLRPSPGADTAVEGPRAGRRPVDVMGLVLLGLAIAAFLVALRGPGAGWLWLVAIVAIVPLAIAFVAVELRSPRPAVDPHLFRIPAFSAAVASIFGATVILHGSFVVVPLLVENLLGQTPETSGLVLLGIAGVAAIVSPFGGRLSDRVGRRAPVVIGSVIGAIALAGLWLPAGTTSALSVALLLGVLGFGNGLTSPRQVAALESTGRDRIGMAAGTYYTGRYLGGVVGAAVAGGVLGTTVTAGGVSTAFGFLAITGFLVAVVSLGLPGRARAGAGTAPDPNVVEAERELIAEANVEA